MTPETTINLKVIRAMKNLQAFYNMDMDKIVEQAMQEKDGNEILNF